MVGKIGIAGILIAGIIGFIILTIQGFPIPITLILLGFVGIAIAFLSNPIKKEKDNTLVQSFPYNLIAKTTGFKTAEFFKQ